MEFGEEFGLVGGFSDGGGSDEAGLGGGDAVGVEDFSEFA